LKTVRSAIVITVLVSSVVLCAPARAQYNGGNTTMTTLIAVAPTTQGAPQTFLPRMHYGALSLHYAPFFSGGRFPGASVSLPGNNQSIGPGGTQTNVGPLLAGDVGFRGHNARRTLEMGGWYWTRGHTDLYELHGRGFFSETMGVQVGYLGSTSSSGSAMDTFLFYDFASQQLDKNARRPWAIEVGIGPFMDFSAGKTTNSFSFYLQGSLGVAKNLSVSLSQWYVRDRSLDNIRLALGLAYRF
jgi:hypothetical protein